jgi:hemerythrin
MLLMWTGNLSVGVPEFDDDHKRLIRMVNEMHGLIQDANLKGKIDAEEIEIALHRLQNYFQYHCLREEKAMELAGFKGLDEHRREHTQFMAKIKEMALRFGGSTDPKNATEIVDFLHDWLITHVHETDMKYGSVLRGSEID